MEKFPEKRNVRMEASKKECVSKKVDEIAECTDPSCQDRVVGRSQFCKRHRDKQYKERHRKRKRSLAESRVETEGEFHEETKRKLMEKVHNSSSSSAEPCYKDLLYPVLAEKRQRLLGSDEITKFLQEKQEELKASSQMSGADAPGHHNISGSSNESESELIDTSTSISSGNDTFNSLTGQGLTESSESRNLSGYQASGSLLETTSSGMASSWSDSCARTKPIDETHPKSQ
eukprot:m.21904 g.21904  ORF g.21904 m.21904 type:complete len:231 (+) comp28241_c0_seq1:10-702(+)